MRFRKRESTGGTGQQQKLANSIQSEETSEHYCEVCNSVSVGEGERES